MNKFGYECVDMSTFGYEHYIFKFENGFGASVVRGYGTYGNDQGLYELAVLKGENLDLCYDTKITDDVIGWCNEKRIEELLGKIKALPADHFYDWEARMEVAK